MWNLETDWPEMIKNTENPLLLVFSLSTDIKKKNNLLTMFWKVAINYLLGINYKTSFTTDHVWGIVYPVLLFQNPLQLLNGEKPLSNSKFPFFTCNCIGILNFLPHLVNFGSVWLYTFTKHMKEWNRKEEKRKSCLKFL